MPDLLSFTSKGIYCTQADIFIDPWKPVDKALITHGHADHARFGHKKYLCHQLTAAIIKQRISPDLNIQTVEYNEPILINGVKFSFHPAGHILGSSQIRVEYEGEVWVASGDYKLENDGLSESIEIIPCHTFISECTFGLPVFNWKPQATIQQELNNWWKQNASEGRPSILYGYSLGKAQRLIHLLDPSIGPIFTHGAVQNLQDMFQREGIKMNHTEQFTKETDVERANTAVIVAPPATFNSSWTKKFKNARQAAASGWMNLRGARRRRGIEKGFVISDHADWKGLNEVIKGTGAEKVIATHGYTDIFSQWLNSQGIQAITEKTAYEGESMDSGLELEVA